MEVFLCPKCREECFREEVDVGNPDGPSMMMCGPWGCFACKWSEWPEYDLSDGQDPIREGGKIDQFGMMHPHSDFITDLYDSMQGLDQAEAMHTAFSATPEELGDAAVEAQFDKFMKVVPPGMTLQQFARNELAKMRAEIPDHAPRESKLKTPYAVTCPDHGLLYLTYDEYGRQMCDADSRWICPRCTLNAQWDDVNFESFQSFDEAD